MADMAVNTAVGVGLTDKKNKNLYTKPMIEAETSIQQGTTKAVVAQQETTARESAETNKLLRELIAAQKSGGNVYMDSTKVGTVANTNTYKTT